LQESRVGENRMHGLMRGSNVLYRKEELDIRHSENYRFEWLLDVIPKNWKCRTVLSTLRHLPLNRFRGAKPLYKGKRRLHMYVMGN
jgi:hypothetical protein